MTAMHTTYGHSDAKTSAVFYIIGGVASDFTDRMERKTQVQNNQPQGFLGLFKGRVHSKKVRSPSEFLILSQRKTLRPKANHNTSTWLWPKYIHRSVDTRSVAGQKHSSRSLQKSDRMVAVTDSVSFSFSWKNNQGLRFKVSQQPPPQECQGYWSVNQQRVRRGRMTVHVDWPPQCQRWVTSPWQPTSSTHDYFHMLKPPVDKIWCCLVWNTSATTIWLLNDNDFSALIKLISV